MLASASVGCFLATAPSFCPLSVDTTAGIVSAQHDPRLQPTLYRVDLRSWATALGIADVPVGASSGLATIMGPDRGSRFNLPCSPDCADFNPMRD